MVGAVYSPVPIAIEAIRPGVGSAVTTTILGVVPFRLRRRFNASVRVFCARSLLIVHLHEMLACKSEWGLSEFS